MTVISVVLHFAFMTMCVLLILGLSLYLYFRNSFKYWDKRNIPHDDPIFPFGSLKSAQNVNFGEFLIKVYNEKMRNHKYFGLWFSFKPCLSVNNPDLIKQMLIKDFHSFHDRGMYYHKKVDPFSINLVTLQGEEWQQMRSKLSPVFSPNKMKMMFPLMAECCLEMIELLRKPAETNQTVEMQDLLSRFTTDVSSSCFCGIKGNCLKDSKAELRMMGKTFFETSITRLIKNFVALFAPDLAKKIKLRTVSKEAENFFMDIFRQLVEHRENNKIKKNDMFQTLIELMNEGFEGVATVGKGEATHTNKLSFEELASQAYNFLVGGLETGTITVEYALYELSLNPKIQEKAREEIKQVLTSHEGNMTYEAISEMKYLGQIVDETLRKYPPTSGFCRRATKTYKIPNTEDVIEKGTMVIFPTIAIQRDEKYFPCPEKFDPDRFGDAEKASRHPFSYLPFGEGHRFCIGKTFTLWKVRTALAFLLLNFKFDLPKNGNCGEFHPNPFFLTPKHMNLKISLATEKRDLSSGAEAVDFPAEGEKI